MNNLSSSLEDYMEVIYNMLQEKESVKAIDIAKALNVSRASVSEALYKLEEKNLIVNEGHKGIKITEEGIKSAQNVTGKHNVLTDFFENVLFLDANTASQNACRVEHVISDDLFERIKQLQKFCMTDEKFMNNFKEYTESQET